MSKCLITGCELVVEGQKWVHGDLHMVGDAYVFNACLTAKGETAWQYDHFPGEERMQIVVHGDYFERRGVIVTTHKDSHLNAKAWNYVRTPVGS